MQGERYLILTCAIVISGLCISPHRFDLQKSQSRVDHLEVRLADTLEELRKRPTLSSSSPNEANSSTATGDKGQLAIGGVVEGGASGNGKEDKATTEEVKLIYSILYLRCHANLLE